MQGTATASRTGFDANGDGPEFATSNQRRIAHARYPRSPGTHAGRNQEGSPAPLGEAPAAVRSRAARGRRENSESAREHGQGPLGRRVVQGGAGIREEGRRARERRRRQEGGRGLLPCVRVLQDRALPVREHAGEEAGIPALAARIPQGGEIFRGAARDRRAAVQGPHAGGLSADSAGGEEPARRDSLGRRGRLEGRPPAPERLAAPDGNRDAGPRHAGHRREHGALRRSRCRAHLLGLARFSR